MPAVRAESRILRAQLASATARAQNDDDANRVGELRRDFAAARLAERIEQVLSTAPPLTPEQRTRLALILAPDLGQR